jgi:hypothetical protein
MRLINKYYLCIWILFVMVVLGGLLYSATRSNPSSECETACQSKGYGNGICLDLIPDADPCFSEWKLVTLDVGADSPRREINHARICPVPEEYVMGPNRNRFCCCQGIR